MVWQILGHPSELRSPLHSLASHHLLLDCCHGLETVDFSHSAVAKTSLLFRGQSVLTEGSDAICEASLDHLELHLHLSFHLKLLHAVSHFYYTFLLAPNKL